MVGLLQVLRGEQHRDTVRDQPADHHPHIGPAARVKPRCRFVQVQHPGVADQAGGQVQPAPHPARVGLRRAPGGVGELEAGEQFARPRPGVRARQAKQPSDHDEVVGPRQPLVHRGVLPGEADELPDLVGVAYHVITADARLAAVRLEQRGEDPDRGRLTRPVRPEHAEDPALPGHQIHAAQRRRLAEPLDEPSGLDRVRRSRVISHDPNSAASRCQNAHSLLSAAAEAVRDMPGCRRDGQDCGHGVLLLPP